jgi:hypothetical protein
MIEKATENQSLKNIKKVEKNKDFSHGAIFCTKIWRNKCQIFELA